MFDLRPRHQYMIGVDIGTSTVKIAGVHIAQKPSLYFYSVIPLPEDGGAPSISESIKKVLQEERFPSRDAVLTFTDESAFFRRIELPHIPPSEVSNALRWKAKDIIGFDVDEACLGHEIVNEFQRDDGSKVMEVLFVAVSKEAVNKNMKILKDAGLNVISVTMAPFGIANIVKEEFSSSASKAVAVVDFGDVKTTVSIFKNGVVDFVRSLPIGSRRLSEAIEGPMVTEKGEVVLTKAEREVAKATVGVSYDEEILPNGINSRQITSLMRHILDQLSKEISRSLEYYADEFGDAAIGELYLAGGGSRLKNLDRYLGEELGITVRPIVFQNSMDVSKVQIKADDILSIAGAVGSALGHKREVDLLPHEYKTEKVEFIEKVSLRITTVVVAAVLAVSFLFTKFMVHDYSARLMNIPFERGVLKQIRDLQERVQERERFLREAEASEIPVDYIMKELSVLLPPNAVLDSLSIGQSDKVLTMRGVVYGPHNSAQGILTKFMEDLESSKYLKDAQLTSVQGGLVGDKEASSFEITSSLER